MTELIEVSLSRILIRETNEQQFICLQEKAGARSFQIVIGTFEALEINRKIKHVETPRPMTHDLLRNILEGLDARVERVLIDDLRDATFFAKLVVKRGDLEIKIDARPSDAIAVAVALRAPIFVAPHVIEEASKSLE
jgi:uncharacterized protein